jgi:carbamoyl-phosphate synthase large subunit
VRRLENLGFDLYATSGTAKFLKENGVKTTLLRWPSELKEPNSATYLTERKIDLVINIPKSFETEEVMNDYQIRRRAVEFGIPIVTNPELVMALVDALEKPIPLGL